MPGGGLQRVSVRWPVAKFEMSGVWNSLNPGNCEPGVDRSLYHNLMTRRHFKVEKEKFCFPGQAEA